MALKPGSRLLHYELVEQIGEGGMGVVWKAEDAKLHREVAIKVLPTDVASGPERLERFEREAIAVAALNHPNIVTVFGIEESDDHRFIAMELIEGDTLDRMMAAGGMPLAKILRDCDAAFGRVGGCSRQKDRAPRPQAHQRHGDEGRSRQGFGFRTGQAGGGRRQ